MTPTASASAPYDDAHDRHRGPRLYRPVVFDPRHGPRLAGPALRHCGGRHRGVGGLDHDALAPLPLPGGPSQPLALLHLPGGRPCRDDDRRRVRADRLPRCHRAVPHALSTSLGRLRGAGLRLAPHGGDHQWPAASHRGPGMAGRPLVGVSVLADRRAARTRLGERHPALARSGHRRVLRPRRCCCWRMAVVPGACSIAQSATGCRGGWARRSWPDWRSSPSSARCSRDGRIEPERRPNCCNS